MLRRTPAISPGPHAIARLERVRIGGVEQWLQLRGRDRRRPVLLFLHGGPGTSQISWARHDQAALEERFVVVNWDQRGAGLSFGDAQVHASLTVERLVQDVAEVVGWLRAALGCERVHLVGHSWGTLLGVLAVQRFPQLFHTYVGVSQVVRPADNERLSYELLLGKARARGEARAVRDLERIGPPPWRSHEGDRVHNKWLGALGGMTYEKPFLGTLFRRTLFAPEYTLLDVVRFVRGQFVSMEALQPQMLQLDLTTAAARVEVPVHLCIGRHDLVAPPPPAEQWFAQLEAPEKSWRWFERSAHAAPFEEAEAFCAHVTGIVEAFEARRAQPSLAAA